MILEQNADELNGGIYFIFHTDNHQTTPRLHKHDFYEITIVTAGQVDFFIESDHFLLSKRDIVIVRPNDVHRKQGQRNSTHINIAFLPDIIENAFIYLGLADQKNDILNAAFLPHRLSLQDFNRLTSEISQLAQDYLLRTSQLYIRLRALVLDIFANYYILMQDSSSAPSTVPDWLNDYILAFTTPDNLSQGVDFFKDAPVSYGHLCRLMKKHFNITLVEYVNQTRLAYASNKLLYSDSSLLQICNEIGFSSLSYFCHLFKKHFGVTPKEYRIRGSEIQNPNFTTLDVTPQKYLSP